MLIRFVDESTGFLAPGHLEQFHAELHVSFAALGVMLALPALGALIGSIAVARSDGTDRKRLMLAGLLVLAAGMALMAAAQGLIALDIAAAAWGFGATCIVDAGEMALANGVDGPLEHTLARANLGGVVGDLFAPLAVAGTRALGIGWRWIFVAAAVGVVTYAAALRNKQFPPPRATPALADKVVPILRHRAVWWIGVAAMLTVPLDESFLGTVLAYVQHDRGASPTAAMLLGAGFVAGGLAVFTVLLRRVAGRAPSAMLGVVAIAMAAAGATVLVAPVAALVFVGVVHSIALDAQWLTMQTAALRVAPGREGRAGALIGVIEMIGLVIPVVLGIVADHHGLAWAIAGYSLLPLLLFIPAAGLRAARTADLNPSPSDLVANESCEQGR